MYSIGEYDIERCAGCGLARVAALPSKKVLDDLYSEGYYAGRTDNMGYYDYAAERESLSKGFGDRLRRLRRYSVRPGRLLDVGCAFGFLLAEAASMGWEPYGVDRSGFGIHWAEKNLGLKNLRAGTVGEAGFEPAFFDAVTMVDVLEHTTDPAAEIESIAGIIKPGGVFLLDTWDIGSLAARIMGRRWHVMAPPDHVFFFDRKTVVALLNRAGFKVEEVSRMGRYLSLATAATKIPEGFLFKKAVLEVTGKLKYPIPVNLFDNLVMISRFEG